VPAACAARVRPVAPPIVALRSPADQSEDCQLWKSTCPAGAATGARDAVGRAGAAGFEPDDVHAANDVTARMPASTVRLIMVASNAESLATITPEIKFRQI
jgi:hypothetical protein